VIGLILLGYHMRIYIDGHYGYLSGYCTTLRLYLGVHNVHVDTEYAEALIMSGIKVQSLVFVIQSVS
jgi:hypothetical protein